MDEVKVYVRDVLSHILAGQAEEETARARLEAAGYRIVGGGSLDGEGSWSITDHRTGEVLASGTGGSPEYERAAEALDAQQPIWHEDNILSEEDQLEHAKALSPPPGIPESLAKVLDEWADSHQDEALEWVSGLD